MLHCMGRQKVLRMEMKQLFMLFYLTSEGNHLPCCPNAVADSFLAYQNLSSLGGDQNFQL